MIRQPFIFYFSSEYVFAIYLITGTAGDKIWVAAVIQLPGYGCASLPLQ